MRELESKIFFLLSVYGIKQKYAIIDYLLKEGYSKEQIKQAIDNLLEREGK